MRNVIIIAAIYLAIGVATFGHAAAAQERWVRTHCATERARIVNISECMDGGTMSGTGAALFWPLYLSWEFWS